MNRADGQFQPTEMDSVPLRPDTGVRGRVCMIMQDLCILCVIYTLGGALRNITKSYRLGRVFLFLAGCGGVTKPPDRLPDPPSGGVWAVTL